MIPVKSWRVLAVLAFVVMVGSAVSSVRADVYTLLPGASFEIAQGQSYAGITFQSPNTNFMSTVSILAGTASSATTVTIDYREPTANESYLTSTVVPMLDSAGHGMLLSDAFDVSGIAQPVNGLSRGPVHQTDVFTIQVSYDEVALFQMYDTPATVLLTEAQHAALFNITVNTLDPGADLTYDTTSWVDDYWVPTVGPLSGWDWYNTPPTSEWGNFNIGSNVVENYQGSWAQFVLEYGVTEENLASFLGSWGTDIGIPGTRENPQDGGNVWAVVDHNSQFAAVPEPGTLISVLLLSIALKRPRRSPAK
ncbi:MAG: hypothetical protein GC164_07355 [Phycisphaera sp.]|nr:hypothetical protein [Phycisphaera sp.]